MQMSRQESRTSAGPDHVTLQALITWLIKRASISGMADAAILQAAGAAAVEAVCDRIEEEINHTAAKDGLKARHRFSPGYGDFALSHQSEVLSMVNATKLTGITLTDGYLMVPSKSVTAVIGLYHEDTAGRSCLSEPGRRHWCLPCLSSNPALPLHIGARRGWGGLRGWWVAQIGRAHV